MVTELNAICGLLASDPTVKDVTLQTPPAGLIPGSTANTKLHQRHPAPDQQGQGAPFLLPTDMSNAISAALSTIFPPVNTAAPAVSGTGTVGQTLTTVGTWTYVPTSYVYQWLRGGAQIANATTMTYVLVAADSGTQVSCRVTAVNAAGATQAYSNAIVVSPDESRLVYKDEDGSSRRSPTTRSSWQADRPDPTGHRGARGDRAAARDRPTTARSARRPRRCRCSSWRISSSAASGTTRTPSTGG